MSPPTGRDAESARPLLGGCLCGAVRYRCDAPPFVAYTCHCLACQRLTGSAFALCAQVPAEALQVTEGRPLSHPRTADSGSLLTTSLCGRCGTALFVANGSRPRLRTIFGGSLDDPGALAVDVHIWTRRKLPWVVLPEGHRIFPGAADWRPDLASDPSRLEG